VSPPAGGPPAAAGGSVIPAAVRPPRPQLRSVEAVLLVLAAGAAVTAMAPVALEADGTLTAADLVAPLSVIALFGLLHLSLVARGVRGDPMILPSWLLLTGLSMALVVRLAPESGGLSFGQRQWLWVSAGVGVAAILVHAPLELRLLRRYRYTWLLVGVALVALTLLFGRSTVPGGPRLWLGAGPFTMQPSELLKLLLVIFLAGYLDDKQELLAETHTRLGRLRLPPLPYLAPVAVMLGVSLALLAVQGDLGAALLLFAIALGMLYVASARLDYILVALGLFAAGAVVLHRHVGVVQTRVAIWLDPWSRSQETGYQLVQSLMALAAGGVIGSGIGLGAATAIPAVHTDFVYAAIAEELGLAGASAVLLVYAVLVLRGFRIAIRGGTPFVRLLAAGLAFSLAVQTFIIIAGVVKLIPLTGITLPLLSYGGSSMLVSAISLGLLLRIDREAE
jgi:cell division protein FtsW (lipid II flippase)